MTGANGSATEDFLSRPGLSNRSSSFRPVIPPGAQNSTGTPRTQSIHDIMTKAENMPPDKVSIKDRIACYKWTFFTMVSGQTCLLAAMVWA